MLWITGDRAACQHMALKVVVCAYLDPTNVRKCKKGDAFSETQCILSKNPDVAVWWLIGPLPVLKGLLFVHSYCGVT